MAARLTGGPWWDWLPLPWRRWRVLGQVDEADEIPDRLPHRGAVVVGSIDAPRWVAFECPCGRGHQLMVNLDRSRHPAWHLTGTPRITLTPSVDDITQTRRCHFFLRDGKVIWVRNAPGRRLSWRTRANQLLAMSMARCSRR